MLESLWVDFAKQVPQLAVLCYMLYVFLQHLSARDEADKTQQTSCHEFQREMMTQANSMSARVVIAFDRNTESLGENNAATERLAALTEDVTRRLERIDAKRGQP